MNFLTIVKRFSTIANTSTTSCGLPKNNIRNLLPYLSPIHNINHSSFNPVTNNSFPDYRFFSTSSSLPTPTEAQKIVQRCEKLTQQILSTSWENYWNLVTDLPFWDSELQKLSQLIQPYLHHPYVSEKYLYLNRLMDLVYQVEDVRDDLNEIIEQSSRSSGIAGVGLFAHDKVDNISDHAEAAANKYEQLLEDYKEFTPQINETVGRALAILRQKQKYQWSNMHSFFY